MKTTVSIPDDLHDAAERLRKRLDISRSHLYAAALRAFLERHRREDLVNRLNAAYEATESSLDATLAHMQTISIRPVDW